MASEWAAPERLVYLAMNKPKNCVTTVSDPEGRPTVMDLLRGVKARVYPVGRLDYSSEGLLLLTNDGEFAKRITSAANHVTKTYLVKTNGQLAPAQEEKFRAGVPLSGKKTAPAGLKLIQRAENPWYEVRLIEGRQNQIRLMFKTLWAAGGKAAACEDRFSGAGIAAARKVPAPHPCRGGPLPEAADPACLKHGGTIADVRHP